MLVVFGDSVLLCIWATDLLRTTLEVRCETQDKINANTLCSYDRLSARRDGMLAVLSNADEFLRDSDKLIRRSTSNVGGHN